MTTVLVLNSSALGEASVSRQLVQDAVTKLQAADQSLKVVTRDIGATPLPHLTSDLAGALGGRTPANDAQAKARALSDELIAELQAADILIIGAPMYNFGIPSTLKAWFDHVLSAGITFRYAETGYVGLLTGKRAIVVMSRGGLFSEGANLAKDAQEPHLRTLLEFIGITDISFVRAERLAMGAEARAQAILAAQNELANLAPLKAA